MNSYFRFISIFAFLSILSIQNRLEAQAEKVPANAVIVMQLDLLKLGKKMDLKNIKNYSFIKPKDSINGDYATSLVKILLADPTSSGLDLNGKIIIYIDPIDSFKTTNYIFPIKNTKQFENKINEFNQFIATDGEYHNHVLPKKLVAVKKRDGVHYVNAEMRMGAAIIKNTGLVFEGPYKYYNNYDYYEHNRARDSVQAIIDSINFINHKSDFDDDIQEHQIIDAPQEIIYEDSAAPPIENDGVVEEGVGYAEAEIATPTRDYYEYRNDRIGDSIMKAFEKWWSDQAKLREINFYRKINDQYIQYMSKLAANNSGAWMKQPEVKAELDKQSDLTLWIDYSSPLYNLNNIFYRSYYYDENGKRVKVENNANNSSIGKYLGQIYYAGHGNFNNGSMTMDILYHAGDSFFNDWKKFYGSGISDDLISIIKTENPLGIASQSIRPKGMSEAFMKMMHMIMDDAKNNGQKAREEAILGFEMLYLFLDKKVVEETFTGDLLIALTGTTTYQKTYIDYVPDDENNYQEVKKTEDAELPLFVFGAGLNIPYNVQYVIQAFERTGYLKQIAPQVYVFWDKNKPLRDRDTALKMISIIIDNQKLIVTNDVRYRDLAYRNGPSKLAAETAAQLKSNMGYVIWDANQTLKSLKANVGMTPSTLVKAEKAAESIKSIEFKSPFLLNNPFKSTFKVEFSDANKNGLVQFFELTELFLSN